MSNTIGIGGAAIVGAIFFSGYFIGQAAGKTAAHEAVRALKRIREQERRAMMRHHYAKASKR